MSRPSRPNFLHPARSAPAPASVTNTNVTAAMVSVPGDVDIDDPNYHDPEHRSGPGSVTGTTAPSTTGSTTTGRASSAFSLPLFASSSSKRSTAPTVSSVSTAPGPIVPVPNVHGQAYTGQAVPVPGSISGASLRMTTTSIGSSTSGASTTTATTATTANGRRAAPLFPPPSQSQSQTSRTHSSPPSATFPPTPRTPNVPPSTTTPSTSQGLPTAQARTAVIASISNLLDRELSGRAALLHQNHNAILKQEREMSKAVEGFKKDNDKLEKLAREGTKRLKEVGDVQNWAEVMERGFLRVEETLMRVNEGWNSERGSEYSGSYSGSWSGSERGYGEEGGVEGGREAGDGRDDGVKNGEGEQKDDSEGKESKRGEEQEGEVEGSRAVRGSESEGVKRQRASEVENTDGGKGEGEVVVRDAEGDAFMTTEDDVQERHTKLDKGKGKVVDGTVPKPSMVPLPQSPAVSGPGGTQFLGLTPATV